jgi:hypothetical protein
MTATQDATEQAQDSGQKLVREIRRTLRGLVVATVILFVALAGVAAYSYKVSDQNRQAVCNLRSDLQRRVATSEEFVVKHPEEIEKLGFTITQVQKEIANQNRTLMALSVVSC